MVTDAAIRPRPTVLAIWLIVGGLIGWWAAFSLTLEDFKLEGNPDASLNCNFSLLVQCGKNLESWQGELLGFPNPLLGIAGFVAPIAVGVAILAGAQFARWFWLLFNAGVTVALAFVIWLIVESIFVLGTLCPYCMVVWAVTIPLFWALTLYNASTGALPTGKAKGFLTSAYSWVPAISVACYLVVAILAQVRLDVLAHL
jgi:uncharacterized membrane protein